MGNPNNPPLQEKPNNLRAPIDNFFGRNDLLYTPNTLC